jgi:chemotaxis protein histidine kinase CheA
MKEKDKFRETIEKIRVFNAGGETRKQDADVFVETLLRAGERAASDLGKKVRLELEQLDSRVIESGPRRLMKEVLTQLVRNAVYHGIETPEDRRSQGKDETGVIRLSVGIKEDAVRITLGDDGRGLDYDRIREKAETLGFMEKSTGPVDRDELTEILFMPGFSTAEQDSIHAGRGIGLNLVRERLQEVRGAITVESEAGRGMAFEIVIPSSL